MYKFYVIEEDDKVKYYARDVVNNWYDVIFFIKFLKQVYSKKNYFVLFYYYGTIIL